MTNLELAATLEALAGKYRENEALKQPLITIWTHSRPELSDTLRKLSGKWKKTDPSDDYTLEFKTDALPGFRVCIPRDKVCRKIVTYDCEPIMSPEEEAEVLG